MPPMSALDSFLRRVTESLSRVPAPLLRLAAGRPRVNSRGDTHDPAVQAALVTALRLGIHFQATDVARGRAGIRRSTKLGCRRPAEEPVRTELRLPSGIAARRYDPPGGRPPRAAMVWIHGGGWVVGDLDTADSACAWFSARADLLVISLDYRRAPEHPWPGPLEDCLAAWEDVRELLAEEGLDHLPLGLGGDSAGGNLSAVVSLRTRGSEAAPAFQLLVYPAVDFARRYPSQDEFSRDLALPETTIDACLAHYAPDRMHPDASPARAPSHEGLPPAIVATCGFDPLRDEGERYVEQLAAAGVPVRHVQAPTLPHGFLHCDAITPAAARAVDELVEAVQAVLDELERAPGASGEAEAS